MGHAHSPSPVHTSKPIRFQKARKQGSANGTADVVMPLCPVQALVGKGTPQSAKQAYVYVESLQKSVADRCHSKRIVVIAQRTSP